jgi:hypothetical protein
LGWTILLAVGCGGNGQQSSDDAFCSGAERAVAARRDLESLVRGVESMSEGEGEAAAAAVRELPDRLREILGELSGAVDEMRDGAEGDVGDALEHLRERVLGPLQDALADAETPLEVAAATSGLSAELTSDAVRRIDAATQERCDVAFAPSSTTTAPAPWDDVDVCSLLGTEVLTDALPDLRASDPERTPSLRRVEGCAWGDPPDHPRVSLQLWNPPDGEEFLVGYEERGQIAGRPAYVLDATGITTEACSVVVDNDEYFVTIDLTVDPSVQDTCDLADDLVASALSALPSP